MYKREMVREMVGDRKRDRVRERYVHHLAYSRRILISTSFLIHRLRVRD